MHCIIGLFKNAKGEEQVRMVFPEWGLGGGTVLTQVSVHPHLCGTCVGGDHTHVEINDTREPLQIISATDIGFSSDELEAINDLLRQKLRVDALTGKLAAHLEPFHVPGEAYHHH